MSARSLLLALVLGGCLGGAERQALDVPGQPGPSGCEVDTDCVAASTTCCGCPDYASTTDRGDACEDVACPPPGECAAFVPRCEQGACVLACPAVTCELACPTGFLLDAAGCETCACADAPSECAADSDCVQVPADCCGCRAGGTDTAVPAADVDDHTGALGCAPTDVCPDVDVCAIGESARCVAGRCLLAPVAGAPGAPCDNSLLDCPPGEVCTLGGGNSDGLGMCGPP